MKQKLTDEDIAGLAQLERDMDAGEQPFVLHNGGRWAFPAELLGELKIKSGQTVSSQLLIAIMERNIAFVKTKIVVSKMENFK